MKKVFLSLFIMLAGVTALFAQTETPKDESGFETYVGYQYLRAGTKLERPEFRFNDATDSHGANVNVTYYTDKRFGFTGEVGANFAKGGRTREVYTAMGGLTIKPFGREKRVAPFGKALLGAHLVKIAPGFRFDNQTTGSGLALSVGAGVDVRVKDNFKVRTSVDYLGTNPCCRNLDNSVRLGLGIVF